MDNKKNKIDVLNENLIWMVGVPNLLSNVDINRDNTNNSGVTTFTIGL
jgi:hypothetical protein